MKPFQLLVFSLVLLPGGLSVAHGSGQPDLSVKPWAKHCHTRGIETRSATDARYVANLARLCEALDACMLACIRSGCAERVGGGCAHMCSGPNGDLNLMRAAAEYEAGTAYLCRRPPNHSFKPTPRRGAA